MATLVQPGANGWVVDPQDVTSIAPALVDRLLFNRLARLRIAKVS